MRKTIKRKQKPRKNKKKLMLKKKPNQRQVIGNLLSKMLNSDKMRKKHYQDIKTEKDFFDVVNNLKDKLTIIIISHKNSNLGICNNSDTEEKEIIEKIETLAREVEFEPELIEKIKLKETSTCLVKNVYIGETSLYVIH